MGEERMMKWFEYGHLASDLVSRIASGPERTVALRKLLESKDAAVRAALHPGA